MTVTTAPSVRLRLVALPVEHGGWSFLLTPIVLGLVVAPTWAGLWLGVAAVGVFLARQPIKLAAGDWRRRKRYPRTLWAERFALLYSLVAVSGAALSGALADAPFWPPLALAAPLGLLMLAADLRNQSRAVWAELAGGVAFGALASAIALASGYALGPALLLWLLLALQAVAAILYVRTRLRLERGQPVTRWPSGVTHAVALAAVAALVALGVVGWPVGVAFAVLMGRAVYGLSPYRRPARPPIVGVQEILFSALTVALIAVS